MTIVSRSWGGYTILHEGRGFLVKKLIFMPGAEMKFQRHMMRMEKWICVRGYGTMTLGSHYTRPMDGELHHMSSGNSLHVPIETWHKFVAGPHGCTIIETWIGKTLNEEDIERG